MNRFLSVKFLLILFFILFAQLQAQEYHYPYYVHHAQYVPGKERGNSSIRANAQMEGNQVRATIFNFCLSGRTSGNFPINVETPFEWPKNTGEVYLAMLTLMDGAEVVDSTGKTQHIIDVPDFRTSPEGKSWNIEPVPGYYNKNRPERSIANSVDPSTWPKFWPDRLNDKIDPGWPGAWNGYFGRNVFNADQEMFYRASDDKYTRYENYFPDSTDLSRRGAGLIYDVRVLSWSQVLVQNVVYFLHKIKNDGTKDLKKVGVTLWFADFVGGDRYAQANLAQFNLLDNILWSRVSTPNATFKNGDPVGTVAVTFLETPGNATDRIDNDGDGEKNSPIVTQDMLVGEIPGNGKDDNGNGLIDENKRDIAFGTQKGFGFADGIDNNGNGEDGSPVVTQAMIDLAAQNKWHIWPPLDKKQQGQIWLIDVTQKDLGEAFKDNIDENGNGELGSPTVTQAMIDIAAKDSFHRYFVPPDTSVDHAPYPLYKAHHQIILYNLTQKDLGKKYADGKDNNYNLAVDENMDEGIDEMIDERRDDGIDNDHDWNPLTDDVGLDGIPNTGDYGEGDGKPTSGAFTGLPGEPDIDVTDVSETDNIGITNAQKIVAGSLNINSDAKMWFDFMIPGKFFNPFPIIIGDYDLFVSSSFFPLRSGQSEPISVAVILANAPLPDPGGKLKQAAILRERLRAQETYNNDYQFSNAPYIPTLTAIPGNNKVTLYWNKIAETSFNRYLSRIGADGHDFEGYKIYRASDPAFLDVLKITNGFGIKQFKTALATFDLKDGIKGFDPIGINGIHYYLGDDSGLRHTFIDTTVHNGFKYYYAVVSYNRGYPEGGIIPAESPMRISLQANGSVKLGKNVVVVTPEAPAAGYVPPSLGKISLVKGSTSGKINYNIFDINKIKNNHVYYITFQDTLKKAKTSNAPDTLTTKNYTLIDSTDNVILVDRSANFGPEYQQPIIDGFKLRFDNVERVSLNRKKSSWTSNKIPPFVFERFVYGQISGEQRPDDYNIIFGNIGEGKSTALTLKTLFGTNKLPAEDVNFKVYNKSAGKFIKFGFLEVDTTGGKGKLTAKGALKDRIIFLEPNANDSLVFTWWFYLASDTTGGYRFPQAGDTAHIILNKPFLSSDIFRFVSKAGFIDVRKAKVDLNNIKVVPNPYAAAALWEPKNPYSSGRGPRELHFTHLPAKAIIRIFTINGELVKTIYHNSQFNDGTEIWNMLSRDNLAISYGVYVYQVEAPGIGSKIGKFAVIK